MGPQDPKFQTVPVFSLDICYFIEQYTWSLPVECKCMINMSLTCGDPPFQDYFFVTRPINDNPNFGDPTFGDPSCDDPTTWEKACLPELSVPSLTYLFSTGPLMIYPCPSYS